MTRAPRAAEVDGRDYHFRTVEAFEARGAELKRSEVARFLDGPDGPAIMSGSDKAAMPAAMAGADTLKGPRTRFITSMIAAGP